MKTSGWALCLASLCFSAHALVAQQSFGGSGIWRPLPGTSFPTFTCGSTCTGVTTPVSGVISLPRFPVPGLIVGITIRADWSLDGTFFAQLLNASPTTVVTADLTGTVTFQPPGFSPVMLTTQSITTRNVDPLVLSSIGFQLATAQVTTGDMTVPATEFWRFYGFGLTSFTLPLSSSFLQRFTVSSGSGTGGFGLVTGPTLSILVRYTYLPAPPFFDLGGAVAGSAGIPTLTATGSAIPGTNVTLQLLNGAPFSPGVLVAAGTTLGEPFLSGVLWCCPALGSVPIATDGSGTYALSFPWPPSLPRTQLTFQAAMDDPTAAFGVGITNGLRGTTH